jgi:hypothetical protein
MQQDTKPGITVEPLDGSPELVVISVGIHDELGYFAHHCFARANDKQTQQEKIEQLRRLYLD